MPLLSRLFGRKQRDDDKTPSSEWPLGAQPLGDRSFGAAPLVPEEPSADDAEIEPGDDFDWSASAVSASAEEADSEAVPGEPESTGSKAEALAAGVALPENEPAHALDLPNEDDESGAPAEAFKAGEGLLPVIGTNDNHAVSSNGSVGGLETAYDTFNPRANKPEGAEDPPFREGTDPFSTFSKEPADAFGATGEPVGTFPLETSNPFATPSDELPEQATQDSVTAANTFGKPQAARINPFMKLVAEAAEVEEAPESPVQPEEVPGSPPVAGGKRLDLVQPAPTHDAVRLTTFAVPSADTEPHTLIGGKEDDLVPVIPDSDADEAATAEIDESGIAEAAVVSLKGSCDFLVARVKKVSAQQDATRVVAGLIALVGELDARYALDMGIRRRNGVEELLLDVRGRMAEGDRFVLESLENGRGGLTADAFLRDLKTIAPSDRPRMLGHYVVFLTFMIKRVLHQYLRPLEEDQTRTYEISYHLDYLVEGVRDMLMSKVSAGAS